MQRNSIIRRRLASLALVLSAIVLSAAVVGAQVPESTYEGLHWRMIGPFRGGRTRAAAGVPSQPNVFYIGQVNGGVWKSDDFGRTWNPIFDQQPTQSIGAIAVAASEPNIVYVSSGEGLHRPDLSVGNGVYKSTDAGKTWTRLGLRDGQQIPGLAVDPRDPNKVFAAVLGHPYGPSEERGIYLSTDGGQNWKRVIAKDEASSKGCTRTSALVEARSGCSRPGRRSRNRCGKSRSSRMTGRIGREGSLIEPVVSTPCPVGRTQLAVDHSALLS